MKIVKLCLLTAFLAVFSHYSAAQIFFGSSIDAEASITLGVDVRIEKMSDLHFGDIMSQPVGGSVRLNPVNGSVSNVSGNFLLLGNSSAAVFQLAGMPGQYFEIAAGSYPSQITLRNEQGYTMTVDDFQILPSNGYLGYGGIMIIKLGATLHIGSDQPAGNYINTTDLTVTVSFQ
ncbi:MAG: DUF4402 domain-containing protein [Bacteroidales bacterium]|jgi:hypothetical protein|nr:DUF4402 domain-containing protein [Bacteroidales bacterium]MDD2263573.1 DUF4402 domain-containing protein [Bacteroidales bacterium]MDD2830636.1 DUF4402 domain-containing protein [Bacteroidales bacterium]MDD3207835.1 DUF4402 domain-containing protein [Bacteroidales bacterium]MDD3697370.1 DUF4402 domain-containing protein [Bacteroidales bacterium]